MTMLSICYVEHRKKGIYTFRVQPNFSLELSESEFGIIIYKWRLKNVQRNKKRNIWNKTFTKLYINRGFTLDDTYVKRKEHIKSSCLENKKF